MKHMTDQELDNLKRIEKDYDAAIEAAADEETKFGLEKLKEFVSDKIDHELFGRMRHDELQVNADTPSTPTPLPFIADFEEASRRRYPVPGQMEIKKTNDERHDEQNIEGATE
jgi:hypothetical protein